MFSRIVKTLLCFTRGTMWENVSEEKNHYFRIFFSGFGWKVFGMIVKTSFWFSRWTFCLKFFVWKNLQSHKFVQFSGESVLAGLSKFFYNFRATFEEKTFVWKKLQLHKFLSSFGWKIYSRIVKIAFFFPQEHFARKVLVEKIYMFIIVLQASVENFLSGLSKLLSITSEEHLWKTLLFEKSYRFMDFLGTSVEIFCRDWRKCIIYFQMNIQGENFVWKKSS